MRSLLILILLPVALMGQRNTASLSGNVLLNERSPGELAASVQVELQPVGARFEAKKTLVNAEGEYRFFSLSPGAYLISASAPGYKSTQIRVEIRGGNQVVGNTKLVLLPEQQAPRRESARPDTVSHNELRAPKKAVRHMQAAELAMEEGDLSKAERAIEKALTLYPDYARAHFQKGRLLEKLDRLGEAIDSYERAIEEDGGYSVGYRALADVYRSKADSSMVELVAQRWKTAVPSEAMAYLYSSIAYYDQGKYHEALQEALAAERLSHDHLPDLKLVLANCYNKLGEPESATAQMEEFLQRWPDHPMAPQVKSSLEQVRQMIRQ